MSVREQDWAAMTQAGLNLIQQALSIYDADLKLSVCNRKFAEMFGLPDAHVTPGTRFEDTIRFLVSRGEYGQVLDPESFIATKVEQARTFQAHYIERERPNGRTISVEGSPLPHGGWVTVYTDITAIKRQELLLRTRSEELSDQLLAYTEQLAQTNRELGATNAVLEETKHQLMLTEARTRTVTEMMPAHIAHVGVDGLYTYSNRRLSAVMPSRPADIKGLHISEALGAEAFAKIAPHLQHALAGQPSVFEFNHDESGRRIRVAFTPDSGPAGAVNGVYILSMDVTEETQARATLIQTRKRELAAQMTSGMAHDFANLLTIIMGLQGRLARLAGAPDAQELIEATQGAVRRGGDLLDRIASISGQRQMRPEPTDLGAFLDRLQLLAVPSLPDGVSLNTRCEVMPAAVMLDAGGLQDALLNLVLNARDAIGSGPGEITVTARIDRDTWIEIRVEDTGPGFSDEALEHALDPFFTTKGEEGSGLGLSMVYDVTKLAGGRIGLANTKTGAQVSLRLPLRAADPARTTMLILLVEDNEGIRESVREMLIDQGHAVIEATCMDEALPLAELPDIDMVLSDMMLGGGGTGADLLDALAKGGHRAKLRLMSSLPKSDPHRQAAQARYPLLHKPFGPADLEQFLLWEAPL